MDPASPPCADLPPAAPGGVPVPPAAGPGPSAVTEDSVAGEEDPGAAADVAGATRAPAPGDQAAPGTPGTGETVCPRCGGSGRVGGQECPHCAGSGRVVAGIGGG